MRRCNVYFVRCARLYFLFGITIPKHKNNALETKFYEKSCIRIFFLLPLQYKLKR